jgi:replicative DNA helicase
MNVHNQSDFRRELPNNLEAEQALLGALLLRNSCMDDVPPTFEAVHFFEPIHREMFDKMDRMHKDGKVLHPVTLKASLPYVQVGGMTVSQYMARLMSGAVNFVSVPDWCKAISFAAAQREVFSIGSKLQDAAFHDELQIPEEIEALGLRLKETMQMLEGEEEGFNLNDAIDQSFEVTTEAAAGRVPSGIDPGIPEIMQLTGPWQNGQLIIIGGGVKQGKTALAMQCMFEIARETPVFLYSGEMTKNQLLMREKARRTGISARQQQRGKVTESEMQQLMQAGQEMKRLQHIEIDCRKLTLEQLARRAHALKKSHGIGAVFVDHIGKIQWEGKMQYEDEFKQGQRATSYLKDLAMDINIPVIALTHLKKASFQDYQGRSAEDRLRAVIHRRPTYRDLVGNMDKDADQVLVAFNPKPILAGMEPGEGTSEYHVWQDLMRQVEGKAEIILSLSRESEFPRRREIAWNGNSTSYGPAYNQAQNRRELF